MKLNIEKLSLIIEYLNDVDTIEIENVIDSMTLRSPDFKTTPDPVKVNFYVDALHQITKQLCYIQIKISDELVFEHYMNRILPNEKIEKQLFNLFGNEIAYVGAYRIAHGTTQKQIWFDCILQMNLPFDDFKRDYFKNLEAIEIFDQIKMKKYRRDDSFTNDYFGFASTNDAAKILANQTKPQQIRNCFDRNISHIENDRVIDFKKSETGYIIRNALRDVSPKRRRVDAYKFDDLILRSPNIAPLAEELWQNYQGRVVNSYHEKYEKLGCF